MQEDSFEIIACVLAMIFMIGSIWLVSDLIVNRLRGRTAARECQHQKTTTLT
ncbi:MAG: hypothetical protein AAGL98_01015 [Planctomycetota bacterium]